MKHHFIDTSRIVAFSGRAGCGKDTAAEALHAKAWRKLALADPLKRDCVNWGLCTTEEAWATKPPRIRRLLQVYGTELRRQYDEDYWLYRWSADYLCSEVRSNCGGVTVPDVRFINEADFFLRLLGVPLIFVVGNYRTAPTLADQSAAHASEASFEAIVAEYGRHERFRLVENNGTVEDLHAAVLDALRGMGVAP